jgi:hypothetical protein
MIAGAELVAQGRQEHDTDGNADDQREKSS